MWLDINTEFHEDGAGIQTTLRFCLIYLRGCKVGITDLRDL
jgi:hypothetical protein